MFGNLLQSAIKSLMQHPGLQAGLVNMIYKSLPYKVRNKLDEGADKVANQAGKILVKKVVGDYVGDRIFEITDSFKSRFL